MDLNFKVTPLWGRRSWYYFKKKCIQKTSAFRGFLWGWAIQGRQTVHSTHTHPFSVPSGGSNLLWLWRKPDFFASYLYSCLEMAITGAWENKNLFQGYCETKMENSLSWEFSIQCKPGMKVHYTPSALGRWGVLMPPCKTSSKKTPRNTLVHPIHPVLDSCSALHSWQQLEAQALLRQLLTKARVSNNLRTSPSFLTRFKDKMAGVFLSNIYLFDCIRSWLWHSGSLQHHMGSCLAT